MMWVMLFTLGKSINRSGADETWDIIGVQHNIFYNFQKGYFLFPRKKYQFSNVASESAGPSPHLLLSIQPVFVCGGK